MVVYIIQLTDVWTVYDT